jgi:hypothetical protein
MPVLPNEILELLGSADVVHQAAGMISTQIGANVRDGAICLIVEADLTGRAVIDIASDVVGGRVCFDVRRESHDGTAERSSNDDKIVERAWGIERSIRADVTDDEPNL